MVDYLTASSITKLNVFILNLCHQKLMSYRCIFMHILYDSLDFAKLFMYYQVGSSSLVSVSQSTGCNHITEDKTFDTY